MRPDFFRARKGMVYLSRVYSKARDGEWNTDSHKMYSALDRKYVKNRIMDEMIKDCRSCDYICNVTNMTDDLYMVMVYVKKDSKKETCFKRLGFNEVVGIA